MPTVPTITPTTASDGVGGGRAFAMPGQTPSMPGVSGFKTAGAPRPAKIGETSPSIRSGDYRAGEIEGRQLQNLGAAVTSAADSVGDIVLKMQEQANATMVTRAGIQMREQALRLQLGAGDPNNPDDPNRVRGFTEVKGYDAVSPPDGKPLSTAYMEQLASRREEIRKGLKNDAQRRAFDRDADQISLGFETNVVKHTMDEYHGWQKSEYTAMATQASDRMALTAPDDVDGMSQARGDLINSVGTRLRLDGASEAEVALATQDALSKAGRKIIAKALAEDNITRAQTYRMANEADFTAQDRLDIDAAIKTKARASIADSVGHDAVYGGSSAAAATPTPTGPRYDAIKADIKAQGGTDRDVTYGLRLAQVESPSDTASNGSSYGRFQFQPATFKGLLPNGDPKDPAQQTKAMILMAQRDRATLRAAGVSDDDANTYIMHQQGAGGGKALLTAPREVGAVAALTPAYRNPATALDAIAGNIGMPYRTADQKAKARARAQSMSAGEFVDYWRTRWAEGAAGTARAPASRPQPAGSLEEATETARARLVAMGADPETITAGVAAAARYYQIHDSSAKEAERTALNAAYAELERNGGNYAALPPALKNAVPASQWDSLRTYATNVGTGVGTKTDPALLLTLTNPNILAATTDQEFMTFRARLSPGDFEQFARERGNLRNPKATAGNSPQDLNREAFNDALKQGFMELDLPTTKSEKGYDANKIGELTRLAQDALYRAQQQEGRKFTDAETTAFVRKVFNTSIPFRRQLFGMEFGAATPGNMLEVKIGDVPRAQYNATLQALRSRGKVNPTDDEILYAWRASHF